MANNGTEFDKALANAQTLGYAEADPTLDISGMDAAQKLAILGSICFDVPCDVEQVHVEGIDGITGEDLEYAHELGYKVRHLGILNLHDDALKRESIQRLSTTRICLPMSMVWRTRFRLEAMASVR